MTQTKMTQTKMTLSLIRSHTHQNDTMHKDAQYIVTQHWVTQLNAQHNYSQHYGLGELRMSIKCHYAEHGIVLSLCWVSLY